MRQTSLLKRKSALAGAGKQLEILSGGPFEDGSLPTFRNQLKRCGKSGIQPKQLEILQLNIGYMCNQVCEHCHVDAGPDRREIMTRSTMEHCLEVIRQYGVKTLDLTGGAPEMNPDFRWLVSQAHALGVEDLIVRSNLTIIKSNPKYEDLPQFFKDHGVHVVSSMPHWTPGKTDKQRGEGVFKKSIEALKALNAVGYGMPGSPLKLDLVYNPSGAFLPSDQAALERDFKKALAQDFDISFHQLFALTNLPISRFLDYLIASENYEDYMYALVEAFNPAAAENVMCTNTLSVSWDGWLYDCDFNQMLDLKVAVPGKHITQFNAADLQEREIAISQHCFGCTAGAGSSCQGTVV